MFIFNLTRKQTILKYETGKNILNHTFGYFLGFCQNKVTTDYLRKFVAIITYPTDVFWDTVSNKKALIIVTHDDDDGSMPGTIVKLKTKGWTIKQLSLQSHILPATGKNPAYMICQGNELILKDGYYHIGLDTVKKPYLPIPYKKIKEQFLTEKVANEIIKKVNEFKPSVIFTLDNEKGGYGYPEHIFISQLVKDLFGEDKMHTNKIYQSVYTDHVEKEIVDKWLSNRLKKWGYPNPSAIANEIYGISGMPEPAVQVNITE